MNAAALFSGGKDSTYALFLAMKEHDVGCLLTLVSENPESYMFHVPNIEFTKMQAHGTYSFQDSQKPWRAHL